jgi:hypothetical protein
MLVPVLFTPDSLLTIYSLLFTPHCLLSSQGVMIQVVLRGPRANTTTPPGETV